MRDGNSFPLVCVCFQVILAYESIVLCKCSGNVLIGYLIYNSRSMKYSYFIHLSLENGNFFHN